MLEIITIPGEIFDEKTGKIHIVPATKITLEHSLVSLSKWESKWKIPFLSDQQKTREQQLSYIRYMTITQNVNPYAYFNISSDSYEEISNYINDPMTATWFNDNKKTKGKPETFTSEIFYYYMFSLNIPIECQKWHLNRLITLIRVFNEKNKQPEKSKPDLSARAALNKARLKQYNTRG